MSKYKTQNLHEDWVKEMEERLEQFPEYTGLKDFMKQASIEKLHELEKMKMEKEKLED